VTWLRTSPHAALIAAIVCEVAATLSLKGALSHAWLILVVVLGYGAAFFLLALCLRRGMAVGVAYGIWGATGVVATAVLSVLIFGESITPVMALGMLLIMAGVALVEWGSHRVEAASAPEPPHPAASFEEVGG
jgi:small multidrug resistance pump